MSDREKKVWMFETKNLIDNIFGKTKMMMHILRTKMTFYSYKYTHEHQFGR